VKISYLYIFILLSLTSLFSCTLYFENENDLVLIQNDEEFESIKPATFSKKRNVKVQDNNNLNTSISKLEVETKKIEAEIGTLLETF